MLNLLLFSLFFFIFASLIKPTLWKLSSLYIPHTLTCLTLHHPTFDAAATATIPSFIPPNPNLPISCFCSPKTNPKNQTQGHHIWNAARTISTFLEEHPHQIAHRTVLELGAGAGLPSLVCALRGAARVVTTDYPDADLIDNLRWNAANASSTIAPNVLQVEGYLWGADPTPLVAHLPPPGSQGFDVLILADLLFNHSEHAKLVESVRRTLGRRADAVAWVFFSPYRPWLLEKDLAFFDAAREAGLRVEKIGERVMEKVMFEEDRGVSCSWDTVLLGGFADVGVG